MGLVVLTSQADTFCKLQGLFGYYHCGLQCSGKKQNIRWALTVEKIQDIWSGRRWALQAREMAPAQAKRPKRCIKSGCSGKLLLRGEAEVGLERQVSCILLVIESYPTFWLSKWKEESHVLGRLTWQTCEGWRDWRRVRMQAGWPQEAVELEIRDMGGGTGA